MVREEGRENRIADGPDRDEKVKRTFLVLGRVRLGVVVGHQAAEKVAADVPDEELRAGLVDHAFRILSCEHWRFERFLDLLP